MIYVLVCLECAKDQRDDDAGIPFGTPRERALWSTEHTKGTGHTKWLVKDVGEPS